MSDHGSGADDAFGDGRPFKGNPLFGDIMKMMQMMAGDRAMNWDAARQFALTIATEGVAEPNVDPVVRMQLEQLARVAELQIANATGLDPSGGGAGLTITPVNRTAWAMQTLDAYQPLFEILADSLQPMGGAPGAGTADDPLDPMNELGQALGMSAEALSGLFTAMTPTLLGLTAGSMVGHLAQRAFGGYDLPIPRPAGQGLLLLAPNLDAFGEEWSLPHDDLRLWVCLHEVAHHTVLSLPHVRERIDSLLHEYLRSFENNPERLEDALGDMGDAFGFDPSGADAFQKMVGDPSVMLGAIQSDHQRQLLPRLEAVVCAVVGYVDAVMDEVGAGLLSNYPMVTEAVRRRRVEAGDADRFVEQLFGLELGQAAYDRGRAFVDGVLERGGKAALARLWDSERELPTPAEIDAPGLWLARIDLPTD